MGSSSVTGLETIGFFDNMSFDGTPRGGAMTLDGQLFIGSTASPHIRVATLTQGSGVTITNGNGTISISATGSGGTVTSVSGTADRITSTGGNTPVIDIAATYVGQSSITTLGTITTGVWTGTTIALANGGTSAALVASNGGIFYSTAGAGAILAGTATANKVLMSGSTAAPTWSTPTFPNASATTGKIIISDGTNWIASTPTYPAAAGTSGNVLTSDGTNWTSAAAAGGGITTVGDVTTGSVAFNGTIGTTLTSTLAGFSLLAANNSGGVGGPVSLTGGATSNAGSIGGTVIVRGGAGNTTGAGGLASVIGGTAGASGAGGGVTIQGAAGAAGVGGVITINGGNTAGVSSAGSAINMQGGNGAGDNTGAGGAINLQGGFGGGLVSGTGGAGGAINLTGGNGKGSAAKNGGAVTCTGGTPSLTGNGGSVNLLSGPGGSDSGNSGSINITTGNAILGVSGNINITGGNSADNDKAASNITITNGRGTGTGTVGKITFLADASGTASGSTQHTSVNRFILNGSVALTSGAAATVATIALATNSSSGGMVTYVVECNDGTLFQSASGSVQFSAINLATVKSGNTSVIGTEAQTLSPGTTLTNTWAVTSGGLLQITSTNVGITPSFYQITYEISCLSAQQNITIP
ncbi:MAG: hypothetical protein V4708_17090 [Bacteroidota bacterium]